LDQLVYFINLCGT